MENLSKQIHGSVGYTLIGFGGACILLCGYHILKRICRRKEVDNRIFEELGQVTEIAEEEVDNRIFQELGQVTEIAVETIAHRVDEIPSAPPSSPINTQEIKELKNISMLFSDYLSTIDIKISEEQVRKRYNYFRTSQDIANFKTDLKWKAMLCCCV